jgi:hypothetical protein
VSGGVKGLPSGYGDLCETRFVSQGSLWIENTDGTSYKTTIVEMLQYIVRLAHRQVITFEIRSGSEVLECVRDPRKVYVDSCRSSLVHVVLF